MIANNLSFGDWKLLYLIMKQLDAVTFTEWMEQLTKRFQEIEEEKAPNRERMPLQRLMSDKITTKNEKEEKNIKKKGERMRTRKRKDLKSWLDNSPHWEKRKPPRWFPASSPRPL